MSRRLLPTTSTHYQHHHHHRVPSSSSCEPHQQVSRYPQSYRNSFRNGAIDHQSDDTFTDYDGQDGGYHYPYQLQEDERFTTEYSDDSGSTRIPHYENDDESGRRLSRNTYSSDRSFIRKVPTAKVIPVHKDPRRAYPPADSRMYQEIQQQLAPRISELPSRTVDRPQSSMSSGVTSAIVDGCGGKCQTCENVCYFFLQLVFMMGILIGVSLSIAGWVLRKSAARNLQVLVYIGVLVAGVSALLLGIQWSARNTAKKRKLAVKNSKRAPIPLETLHPRGQQDYHHQQQQQQQQLPLVVVQDGPRVVPQVVRPVPPVDQQGVPWWRRKDIP